MSRNSETLRLPSLAQHFNVPKNHTGNFGWLCGYSADALFLNDAAGRFTGLSSSQRSQQGHIALAVLLDPGSPVVSLLDAPGVAHFPIKDHSKKPFRLLHSKVALLGFQHNENRDQWQLRLLVSTGNWTRQTLEESLDLVWRIDIASESLRKPDANIKQGCADIKAAWDLMAWIQNFFDTRLLKAMANGQLSETMTARQQINKWIEACSKQAKGKPRFFDNRKKSLLYQLPGKAQTCGDVKRNYLAMGSGFYEASADPKKPPEVPVAILKKLRDGGLLTAQAEVDLYVNPAACQSIATSVEALKGESITIRPAAIPTSVFGEGAQRNLHAKFLFSANYRDNSNVCTSAWVYLGSGNLTHPGFANKMNVSSGNLEAGVVFASNSLCWEKNKKTRDDLVVTNLLPIQWEDEIDDVSKLEPGNDMEPRDTVYFAAPVPWLTWHEVDGVGELRTKEHSATAFEVIDSAGNACLKTQTGIQWREEQPRQVCILWQQENGQHLEALIPVVDQYGRIAATKLPAIEIDEAWWQLEHFPLPQDDEGGDDEESIGDENTGKDNTNGRAIQTTSYPIRQMMELIESIAAKQTAINKLDWVHWCNCLEQTLGQASDSNPVKYFREELKLNPLSPLRYPPFRPSFAESCDSDPGKLYDETLVRIEVSWKVNELSPIGGSK